MSARAPNINFLNKLLSIAVLLFIFGCKQAQKLADIIVKPSPREVYARQFENDTLVLASWKNAFINALNDSLNIELPYSENGNFKAKNTVAYSYNLFLQRGEILHVEVRINQLPIFINLYEQKIDSIISYEDNAQNDSNSRKLIKTIEESGIYKVVVQPGIGVEENFDLEFYSTPSYSFPVTGKNNEAIQSFWGADRDGGKRSHEGVDIFADKGTPVVAITEGRVSSTRNRGLGGKQVWLKSGLFGNSLYYAHLDSILVTTGDRVNVGDTLGLIGNTGNARTTAPHLHFGIYEGYRGAIDPLPFIRVNDRQRIARRIDSIASEKISVLAERANLRQSPSLKGNILGEVTRGDSLSILGITDEWAHVQAETIGKAFVHQSLIELKVE